MAKNKKKVKSEDDILTMEDHPGIKRSIGSKRTLAIEQARAGSDKVKIATNSSILKITGLKPKDLLTVKMGGAEIVQVGRDAYDLIPTVQGIVKYFKDKAAKASMSAADELKQARLDDMAAKTRKTELEIAHKEEELVSADGANIVFAETMRRVSTWIDALPDTLERVGVLDKRGVERCRIECDTLRAELHAKLEREIRKQIQDIPSAESSELDADVSRVTKATTTGVSKPKRKVTKGSIS